MRSQARAARALNRASLAEKLEDTATFSVTFTGQARARRVVG
jgi:hypothetical protein